MEIAEILEKGKAQAEFLSESLREDHFDQTKWLFFSGPDREISYASQIWAILADVLSPGEARKILSCLEQCQEAFEPASPYLHHHHLLLDAYRYAGGGGENAALHASLSGLMVEKGDERVSGSPCTGKSSSDTLWD